MKIHFTNLLTLSCLVASAQFISVGTPTVIPAMPNTADHVMIITNATIPNQGIKVGNNFSVSHNPQSIDLTGCYWDGQMLPAIKTFVDTFHVGQLSPGIYACRFMAFVSQSQNVCIKNDSNWVSFSITVDGTTTDIEEKFAGNFTRLFPNPADSRLSFTGTTPQAVEIYSAGGQIIKKVIPGKENTVEISELKPGLYQIKLIFQNDMAAYQRFIKTD